MTPKQALREIDQILRISREYIRAGEDPAPYDPEVLRRWYIAFASIAGVPHEEVPK